MKFAPILLGFWQSTEVSGNSIALNAGIVATNSDTANTTVQNSFILNSNQTITINAGSGNLILSGAIDTNGKDLTFDVTAPSIAQIQSVISGAGGLIKTGSGTVYLYSSNTFSGPVQLTQGFNGPINLASNPTIQVSSTFPLTINGVISGSGGFNKTMSGALTLNGNNTYTGTTTASAGTLRVNDSQPASPIVLGSATLGGTGTVGPITASNPGILAPGASPGILSCSSRARVRRPPSLRSRAWAMVIFSFKPRAAFPDLPTPSRPLRT